MTKSRVIYIFSLVWVLSIWFLSIIISLIGMYYGSTSQGLDNIKFGFKIAVYILSFTCPLFGISYTFYINEITQNQQIIINIIAVIGIICCFCASIYCTIIMTKMSKTWADINTNNIIQYEFENECCIIAEYRSDGNHYIFKSCPLLSPSTETKSTCKNEFDGKIICPMKDIGYGFNARDNLCTVHFDYTMIVLSLISFTSDIILLFFTLLFSVFIIISHWKKSCFTEQITKPQTTRYFPNHSQINKQEYVDVNNSN
ncbi:hypothetical protein EDI_330900 [Entamoeba dispar SAW760]|uniref:Uncharacterized protein n=1 Tax=Entamoeba dispar (strain ATCC PRA-260 / SAW760) TaxID=370354 RepID=B0EUB7_ENTDS|nr:uncharacterized protein EDI_330900 [Entamoeba dispar SAW760]EDR21868.1 hypothetical protein EDI_330900 [Entamoeba dispar SAW760]|eukprot:EDR21868.1 hypothetical protein EDI_330900 [Entamoeba dispar SAW760]